MKNWKRIIGCICGAIMLIFLGLYLITDSKWAHLSFAISLCIVSLYNLFLNPANRNNSKDKD